MGRRSIGTAIAAIVGSALLLLLLAVALPSSLALLKHWGVNFPENNLPILLISGTLAFVLSLALLVIVISALGLADPGHALALPEGSIRAVIALLLILLFFISAVFLYSNGRRIEVKTLDSVSQATLDAIPPDEVAGVQPSEANKDRFVVLRRLDTSASDDLATQLLTTIATLAVAVAAFYFGANSVLAARGGAAGDDLGAEVRAALSGDAFKDVVVSVAGGSTILTGSVASKEIKDDAEGAALRIGGIERVRNYLVVEQSDAPLPTQPPPTQPPPTQPPPTQPPRDGPR